MLYRASSLEFGSAQSSGLAEENHARCPLLCTELFVAVFQGTPSVFALETVANYGTTAAEPVIDPVSGEALPLTGASAVPQSVTDDIDHFFGWEVEWCKTAENMNRLVASSVLITLCCIVAMGIGFWIIVAGWDDMGWDDVHIDTTNCTLSSATDDEEVASVSPIGMVVLGLSLTFLIFNAPRIHKARVSSESLAGYVLQSGTDLNGSKSVGKVVPMEQSDDSHGHGLM